MVIYTIIKFIDANPELLYELSPKYDTPLSKYICYKLYMNYIKPK